MPFLTTLRATTEIGLFYHLTAQIPIGCAEMDRFLKDDKMTGRHDEKESHLFVRSGTSLI